MDSVEPVSIASDSKNFQAIRDRLQALKMLQREYVRVETNFHREFYALDIEYHEKRQKIYDQRRNVITGDGEFSQQIPSEIVNGVTKALEKLQFNKSIMDDEQDIKGIPNFWLQALKNCTHHDELIHDCDDEALNYLLDIRVRMTDDPEMSFTLEFEFSPNPCFQNAILTKQYFLSCDTDEEFYGFSIIKATGCTIEWKENMNILDKEVESFFKFFNPPVLVESSGEKLLDIESSIFFELQQDFEIGLFIKEKLIPNAVLYFLNEIDEVTDGFEGCEGFGDTDETIVEKTNF